MEKKKHPQSMSELARELNLSRATVSYIINDRYKNYNISEATAARVRKYIKECGFAPNIFSLALKGKLNKDIAILMPPSGMEKHQQSAFFSMLRQIHENDMNYIVLPCSKRRYQDIVQQMKTYRLHKAIVIAAHLAHEEHFHFWQMIFKNLPEVNWCFYEFPFGHAPVKKFAEEYNVCCVGIDRKKSYLEVLRYIASMGYKKLILASQVHEKTTEFVASLGMELQIYETLPSNISDYETGYRFGETLLKNIARTKDAAVYINDDLVTAGAIEFLVKHKIKVPEEIAFLSWDALEESRHFPVPLTSMKIPHDKMVKATLMWAFANKQELKHIALKHKFSIEVRDGESLPEKKPLQ